MAKDNKWSITLKGFNAGLAPLAFSDSLTEIGGGGSSSEMTNCNILDSKLTQGDGLATLTNGTEDGVVTELINFIMDRAVSADVTYGIGDTKLFKISSTTVASGGTPSWPRTVSNMTEGSSVIDLNGNLYYLYNTASAGAIGKYDLATTFTDSWKSTGMVSAPHPVATKEDTMVFGNGRYLGVYIETGDSFNATKLDFGEEKQVDDVLFSGNQWYVVVNSSITGTNRSEGQIYLYDGSATTSVLTDETGVGAYRIGFIYRLNGILYIAYQDLSSTGFIIGYISGSQIKPLGRFNGTLPTFAQKTLYKNTILFLSSGLVYSAGALVDDLPFQLSQIADGGFATCGAIAAPFGTPMIASNLTTQYKLAKFSGYDVNSAWKSIIFPLATGRAKGYIDSVVVLTQTLETGARCNLKIEVDQSTTTSSIQQITGVGKRKHTFKTLGLSNIEDFNIALDFSEGSATKNVVIRSILINGHYLQD